MENGEAPATNAYENEVEAASRIHFSIHLVPAAKKRLKFLRRIDSVPVLHQDPVLVLQAIRRYEELWMPLAAEEANTGSALLPPLDVQWVWHCHCLNPRAYQKYCFSKFSKMIDKPVFLDEAAEAEALDRSRKVWSERYNSEPFDLKIKRLHNCEAGSTVHSEILRSGEEEEFDLVSAISKQSSFYHHVCQSYMLENAFLEAAIERYKRFLHMVSKCRPSFVCVPTLDILLIWTTHQSFPVAYARDIHEFDGAFDGVAIERGPNARGQEDEYVQETARLWETIYGQPYEKAGATFQDIQPKPLSIPKVLAQTNIPRAIYWEPQDIDVNKIHHVLKPRFVMEVCILMKAIPNSGNKEEFKNLFVRLRALDSYKQLKIDKPLGMPTSDFSEWHKLWILQCESSSRGLILELSSHVMTCLGASGSSRRLEKLVFVWEEILKSRSLTMERIIRMKSKVLQSSSGGSDRPQIRIVTSITPPIQAPYLFKCVPDRVTDDSGAMLSDIILRMNKYTPQAGRWISRTVLNHSGKECFVIRIRVATGIWRRCGDRPVGVDWNERIIQICEGGWSYVAGTTGIAPSKIVGTATPVGDDLEHHRMSFSLSTGETFTIRMRIEEWQWERYLQFTLTNTPKGKSARLLNGRKLEYEVAGAEAEEEEGFVTLVRYTSQSPKGKATALLNWKVSAVEFVTEEDAVLVLLLCTATVQTLTDFGCDSVGNFFITRRMKEAAPGTRDWGSVVIQNSSSNLGFWYLNPREVLGVPAAHEQRHGRRNRKLQDESGQVYRSGSWLHTESVYENKTIRKAASSAGLSSGSSALGGRGGGRESCAHGYGVGSTRGTSSSVPVIRRKSFSLSDIQTGSEKSSYIKTFL
eukprot:Gb_23373 [translate_table: standard]